MSQTPSIPSTCSEQTDQRADHTDEVLEQLPSTPQPLRVHCVEASTEHMEKLEALLNATDSAEDHERRQRGLQVLSRSFTLPSDATVAVVKAHILSNGSADAAAIGEANLGKLSLFALQRPLPQRMAAVQDETQQSQGDAAALPLASQSYDIASLVALPGGLPLRELVACDQFFIDLDEELHAPGAREPTALTLFYRDEHLMGACCGSWCRTTCCRACVCDACCKPASDVRVRAPGVRVVVQTSRGDARANRPTAGSRSQTPAQGTVLEFHDTDESAGNANPLSPQEYARATKSGGHYYW